MAATITTAFYDAIAGAPTYTAENMIDWVYQLLNRPIGVIPGLDLGLLVATDGLGNVTTQNGVCVLGGRTAVLSGGPLTTAIPSLPANGFRTAYAVVMRFNPAGASTSVVLIAGSTIANPGPAVNPSIVSATDVLLAYVLVVNTGSNAYTVTDARSFSNIDLQLPVGTTTYTNSQLGRDVKIFAALTGTSVLDISAGALNQGTRCFVKNVSAAPQTLTLRIRAGGTGSGFDITLLQNEWVQLIWDGILWLIVSDAFTTEKIFRFSTAGAISHSVPAGRIKFTATLTGAGGGGAGGTSSGSIPGSGGGGGGTIKFMVRNVTPGQSIAGTVGTGGTGGGQAANGTDGSDTTLTGTGGVNTAKAGTHGSPGISGNGNGGGIGTVNDILIFQFAGQAGGSPFVSATPSIGGYGGGTLWGPGNPGVTIATQSKGPFPGNGGAGGDVASGPTGRTGAAGNDGIILLEY